MSCPHSVKRRCSSLISASSHPLPQTPLQPIVRERFVHRSLSNLCRFRPPFFSLSSGWGQSPLIGLYFSISVWRPANFVKSLSPSISRSPKAGHNKTGRSDVRNQRFEPDPGEMRKMRKVPHTPEKKGLRRFRWAKMRKTRKMRKMRARKRGKCGKCG